MMGLRITVTTLICGVVVNLTGSACGQTISLPAPQAAHSEPSTADSDRVRRINEQIEIRRSQSKLRSRNELAADQAATRCELERLTRLRDGTTGYLTGRINDADLVALSGLRQQVGHLPSVVAALQQSAPQLLPEDFVQQTWRDIVETDGRLAPAPRFLRVIDGYQALQRDWDAAADELRGDRRPSDEALLNLEEGIARWEESARRAIDAARALDRREAVAWLNRVKLLLRNLDEVQMADLSIFVRNGGHTYPGGTVGELLGFLIDHRLNLQPGRAGHAVLAGAAAVLLAEVDADIAVLEDRIEFYKQQDGSGGSSQPGRMILRPNGLSPEPAPSLPRRETVVPASQPLTLPGRNVAEMR
jgi:hypothetical protein